MFTVRLPYGEIRKNKKCEVDFVYLIEGCGEPEEK